jgi:DNA-binding MarR family transcriptional regulator
MDDTAKTIDDILARLFITTFKIEEKAISRHSGEKLSISELHVLREIGMNSVRTMTQVANRLKISVGALTTAMNKLEAKGFVVRERGEGDRRIVNVSLTKDGRDNLKLHDKFHEQMVGAAVSSLTDDEQKILLKSLSSLDEWFIRLWKQMEKA